MYNIMRELASTNLSMNTEAVGTLMIQAAWQAGSPLPNSHFREAHFIFENVSFCRRLYEVLFRAVRRVEANWKELNTMGTLIILSHRLLSLTNDGFVIEQTLGLLSRIRQTSPGWTRDLAQNMHSQGLSGSSNHFQQKLLMAALICRMTYFVDSQKIHYMLQSSSDVATFVEYSIRIPQIGG